MKLSDIKVVQQRQRPIDEPMHEIYDTPERDVLVLNYTLACPLSCDFCCYGCHPKRKEKMPLEAAKDLVSQAAKMPNFSAIGLTGGEVFMFEDELLSLSAHIHSFGLPFTVATAAHWATTPRTAEILAKKLVSNGLSRANISYDPSHSVYVPAEHVSNAALAFSNLGVPVYIVGTYYNETDRLEADLPRLCRNTRINLLTKRIAKVGRATKAEFLSDSKENNNLKACYRRRHHDLVVFWDGECFPCCSTFNRATKGISVGNAFETPLNDLWQRVEYSMLIKTMKSSGFERVIEIIKKYNPELAGNLPDLSEYPGACSYCNKIFSNKDFTKAIRAVFAKYETDQIISSLSELNALLGEATVAQLIQQSKNCATGEIHDANRT